MKRRALLTGSAALAALAGCASPDAPPPVQETPATADALQRIAFGSCCDQNQPQPIWDPVLAGRPELFLFGGDNVYASAQPWSLAQLESAYARQAAVTGFAKLRASVPHLAIWDDHDYGSNDGGVEFSQKQAAKDAFLSFWRVAPGDERRGREGLYHARVFGAAGRRVQVIIPDIRWFRSRWKPTDERGAAGKERYVPDADPTKTMLGEVQWRWLEEQLRQPAELRLVFSSIQVLAEGHGWERWGNFPLERARLLKLLARANGVVLLSGDRHIGAIYRESAGLPYPLYEVTASGFTHPWGAASEPGPNRVGELFTEQHYGSVEIDWRSGDVQLALRDGRGEPRRSQLLNFNRMKATA